MTPDDSAMDWLLDSDPAIRWQVLRDVTDAPTAAVAAERSRVATEGWGARLLAAQTPDGGWGGTTPGDRWRFDLYTLHLLAELGPDPAAPAVRRAIERTRDGVTWGPEFGDSPFFEGEEEPCINGRVLLIGATFGEISESLIQRLLGEQLDDGGWNCDAPLSRRSSFHTTICVLEGLLAAEMALGQRPDLLAARRRGEDYLLERRLLRRRRTGEIIDPSWLRFAFPSRSDFDLLRGLDYFQSTGDAPDPRLDEALAFLRERRDAAGRWALDNPELGYQHVDMGCVAGQSSRWITLRARRVLRWADQGGDSRSPGASVRPSH
ncbi:hypothetical protein N1027_11665 [Herbiconiux sp. CPCC 205763]|uniref:Squalene cyclase n=1 Tax=Herbiconiux aconitum TaxID=2970913 RepID=A0ABT2GRP3_9MICO|nr:hypothetical protein [Herbiconiux aconitum]MCS5718791.1 hypothetical protein [Herbiconiux aconitum]